MEAHNHVASTGVVAQQKDLQTPLQQGTGKKDTRLLIAKFKKRIVQRATVTAGQQTSGLAKDGGPSTSSRQRVAVDRTESRDDGFETQLRKLQQLQQHMNNSLQTAMYQYQNPHSTTALTLLKSPLSQQLSSHPQSANAGTTPFASVQHSNYAKSLESENATLRGLISELADVSDAFLLPAPGASNVFPGSKTVSTNAHADDDVIVKYSDDLPTMKVYNLVLRKRLQQTLNASKLKQPVISRASQTLETNVLSLASLSIGKSSIGVQAYPPITLSTATQATDKETEELRIKVAQLQSKADALSQRETILLEKVDEQVKSMQDYVDRLQQEFNRVSKELSRERKENDMKTEQLLELQIQSESQQSSSQAHDGTQAFLSQQHQQQVQTLRKAYESELVELRTRVERKTIELDALQIRHNSASTKNTDSALILEMEQLRRDRDNLDRLLKEQKALNAEQYDRIVELENGLGSKNASPIAGHEDIMLEDQRLKDEVETITQEVLKLQDRCSNLLTQNEELSQSLDQEKENAQRDLGELQRTIDEQNEIIAEKKAKIKQFGLQSRQSTEQDSDILKENELLREQIESASKELSELQDRYVALSTENDELKDIVNAQEQERTTQLQEKAEVEQELNSLKSELERLRVNLETSERRLSDFAVTQYTTSELQETVRRLKEEKSLLEVRVEMAERKREEMEYLVQDMQQMLDTLGGDLNEARNIQELEKKVESQRTKMEELQEERDAANTVLEALEERIQDITNEIGVNVENVEPGTKMEMMLGSIAQELGTAKQNAKIVQELQFALTQLTHRYSALQEQYALSLQSIDQLKLSNATVKRLLVSASVGANINDEETESTRTDKRMIAVDQEEQIELVNKYADACEELNTLRYELETTKSQKWEVDRLLEEYRLRIREYQARHPEESHVVNENANVMMDRIQYDIQNANTLTNVQVDTHVEHGENSNQNVKDLSKVNCQHCEGELLVI